MTVLFYVFVVLAIYHFVWEGIIAPSVRLEIRYELFELRDRLRRIKIEQGNSLNDELFTRLQRSINKEIALLQNADIRSLYYAYTKLYDKKDVLDEIETFDRLVEECSIEEVRNIRHKSIGALAHAFVINSGGWLIYIIPVFLIIQGYEKIKALLKRLTGLSENDIDKMFPPTTPRPREV